MQTLPNREQGEHKVTYSSWKLASMDRGTGCLLPKMGDEGRGESACMAPQGIIGRQPAGLSPPCCSGAGHGGESSLVVWRGLCLCEGLESSWIVMGRVTSHGADFETDSIHSLAWREFTVLLLPSFPWMF